MSNRIEDIFTKLRSDGRTALMPFVTAGYPSLVDTAPTILAMDEAGASIVEIGIPFSDPIADGPVIAQAMHEALAQGVTPPAVFEVVASLRKKTNLGLIAMVSDSIVMRYRGGGPERFIDDAAKAGIDGFIIPDLDTATAQPVADLARKHDMTLSMLIAPTSTSKRIASILPLCSGFVYLLARAGVTGERQDAPDLRGRIALIRGMTDLPIAVGFGISTSEHVRAVTSFEGDGGGADAAIVGSAIVRAMGEAVAKKRAPAEAAANLVRQLATGLGKRAPNRLAASPPA